MKQQQPLEVMQDNVTNVNLKFADSKLPEMKKVRGFKHIRFGDKDNYPNYILELYNKSAKHNSIINSKCVYILGNGLDAKDDVGKEFLKHANETQSWDSLLKMICVDIENFGGFYLEVVPKLSGNGYNYYHISFDRIRTNESNSKFWYKKNWEKYFETSEDPIKEFVPFKNGIKSKSIYCYKEYRAGRYPYSLPSWVACCNWIESDIEISKSTLTNAKTGFSPTKFINFFNGEPAEDKKRSIEKRFQNKFSGSEGTKLMIGFNNDPNKAPTVQDLGVSDLSKEDFSSVNDLVNSNMYAGHCVTHPLLFGIQQAGKLGSSSELKIAYDIFKNTYCNSKQRALESIVMKFAKLAGINTEITIKDVEPIGIEMSDTLIQTALDRDELRKRIGYDKSENLSGSSLIVKSINSLSPLVANKVLESMTDNEIRALAGLSSTEGGDVVKKTEGANVAPSPVGNQAMVNDVLTNLTGRQIQNITRIVRHYGEGKTTAEQARLLLKGGYGFTDEEANTYLGIENKDVAEDKYSEVEIAMMFDEIGENFDDYVIVKSDFYSDEDSEMQFAFDAVTELTSLRNNIAELIKSQPSITNRAISEKLLVSTEEVNKEVSKMIDDGIISKPKLLGGGRKIIGDIPKVKVPEVMVRYSYEKRPEAAGPSIKATTRPLCKRLVELNRLYTKQEIQKISERVGFNVFKRSGGFWTHGKKDAQPGKRDMKCRHEWKLNVVVKKENK